MRSNIYREKLALPILMGLIILGTFASRESLRSSRRDYTLNLKHSSPVPSGTSNIAPPATLLREDFPSTGRNAVTPASFNAKASASAPDDGRLAGRRAMMREIFNLEVGPYDVIVDDREITGLRLESISEKLAAAGLRKGDILLSINGLIFTQSRREMLDEVVCQEASFQIEVIRDFNFVNLEINGFS